MWYIFLNSINLPKSPILKPIVGHYKICKMYTSSPRTSVSFNLTFIVCQKCILHICTTHTLIVWVCNHRKRYQLQSSPPPFPCQHRSNKFRLFLSRSYFIIFYSSYNRNRALHIPILTDILKPGYCLEISMCKNHLKFKI